MVTRLLHAALFAAAVCAAGFGGCAASEVMPMTAASAELVAAAIDDAVERTGVARDAIEVVSAEAVTWPDGSLGCPRPGMMYTQALVPGHRIVLRAGGETLNYHVGSRGAPVFCPADRVVAPLPAQEDPSV